MASITKKTKSVKDLAPEQTNDTQIPSDRGARIAELAYYKAEQRGFEPGSEIDDWLQAERELLDVP